MTVRPMSQTIFDIRAIMGMLAHRFPFLLVDKVVAYDKGHSLTAVKNVTYNEPFFQGHFPLVPTMPGVLILEALAQTCGLLTAQETGIRPDSGVIFYFAGIDNARFKRIVEPGDQLELHAADRQDQAQPVALQDPRQRGRRAGLRGGAAVRVQGSASGGGRGQPRCEKAMSASPRIHPTAIVDPGAELHETVEVGPYSVIGPGVQVGEGSWIGPHVVLRGPMRIGKRNRIYQFASLGEISQDMTAKPEESTRVEIGDDNTIREYVTIQRGTLKEQGLTRIGNDNWIMAYCHIAHDCIIDDHTIFANGTTLAGHVHVEDWVGCGGYTLVHQFCRIGAHSFSAGGAGITRDVPPFVVVQGNPAAPRGINIEGIRRRGFTPEEIGDIKEAYKLNFMSGMVMAEVKLQLAEMGKRSPHCRRLLDFIESSKRALQR